jgi:S1-C subfamily serine protease
MNSRAWRIIALVVALLVTLSVGAVIGGGIVYAATRVTGRAPQVEAAEDMETEPGIVILRVVPGGPAAEAGVVRGDILLAMDGERLDDLPDLQRVLEGREPGDDVELAVLHGDEERALEATLGDRNGGAFLGLMSCECLLDAPLVRHQILGEGALIVDVTSDSPAAQAGLKEGDRITAVEGQSLEAKDDLADLIATREPGDSVTLTVARPGEEPRDVTLRLGEHPDDAGRAYLGIKYVSLPRIGEMGRDGPSWSVPRFGWGKGRSWVWPPSEFEQGAIIQQVIEDSPAAAAGLHEGDIITAIDGEQAEGPRALAEAIAEREPDDSVTLTVVGPDETEEREVEVTLAEDPDHEGSAYLGVVIGGFFMRRFEHFELPPDVELPDEPLRFRLPFMKTPLDLDLGDVPRRFEFRFGPRELDLDRLSSPGDSA